MILDHLFCIEGILIHRGSSLEGFDCILKSMVYSWYSLSICGKGLSL